MSQEIKNRKSRASQHDANAQYGANAFAASERAVDAVPYPANETANMKPTLSEISSETGVTSTRNGGADARRGAGSRRNAGTRRGATPRRGFLLLADRYLLQLLIGATLSGLLRFGGLLFIVAAVSALRKASQEGLPSGAMLEMIVLQMPRIFLFALPMSLLYGTVQVFADLSGRGEITALWAGGMSLKRMLRAPILWGLMLSLTAFFVQEVLVPGAESKRSDVVRRGVDQLGTIENFRVTQPSKGPLQRIIQAELFDPRSNTLIRPSIQLFRGRDVYLQITAERGEWNETTGLWKFTNGKMINFPEGKSNSGASQVFEFPQVEKTPDEVGSPNDLKNTVNSRARHLAKGDFEMVSIAELAAYRQALVERQNYPDKDTQKLIKGATYGIHDKIATPLLCLALVLVGAPLGLRPQRSSASFAPGISLLVIMLYYLTWTGASYPGKEGSGAPLLLAYLAPGLTAIIGLFLVWKKNR